MKEEMRYRAAGYSPAFSRQQPHGAQAGLAIPAAARTSEPQLRSLKIPDGRAGCAVSVSDPFSSGEGRRRL